MTRLQRRVTEDYVKVIFAHTEWQPRPITTSALAARLGLAPSSVTEMVKKLSAQSLLTHEPYGAVVLTPEGERLAIAMVRRHRLIETWLVARYGFDWDEVHDEAEVLEHALSDRLLEAIDAELGHPVRDPHGDAIPRADGTIERPAALPLNEVTVTAPGGIRVSVARISDGDPALLRTLASEGIGLDTVLSVEERRLVGPREPSLRVRVADPDREVLFTPDAASSIWVVALG